MKSKLPRDLAYSNNSWVSTCIISKKVLKNNDSGWSLKAYINYVSIVGPECWLILFFQSYSF